MRRIALLATVAALVRHRRGGVDCDAYFRRRSPCRTAGGRRGSRPSGTTFFVGSLRQRRRLQGKPASPATARASFRAQTDRVAVGVDYDRGRLFVAGGGTGDGYVYDAKTGAQIASYDFASPPTNTFVNDVIVTRTAAWFTESRRAFLYQRAARAGR